MDDPLKSLAERFDLPAGQAELLGELARLSLLVDISGTAIEDFNTALDVHIADSVAGTEVAAVKSAMSIVDIGSGIGFPGLVLAALQPETKVVLVDSVRKKMEAAARIARELKLDNAEAVWGRAEELSAVGGESREAFDVVAARALAELDVLLEYAAPLLKVGGSLVAWKGAPTSEELAGAQRAAQELGFAPIELVETKPFRGSRTRHFVVAEKLEPTSEQYPRRAGVALKKPLGRPQA